MINRVTDTIKFNMITNSMFKIQGQYGELMEKLSTQKNVNRPSDDPVAMNNIMDYRTILASIEQYQSNITDASTWLNLTTTNLSGLRNIVDEALSIAVTESGASGSVETRATSLSTLNSLLDEALSLLNAQSGDNYIFGGSATDMQPFSLTYAPDKISDASAASTNTFSGTATSGGYYTGTANQDYEVRIVGAGDLVTATYQLYVGGAASGGVQDFPPKVVKATTAQTSGAAPMTSATVWNDIDGADVQDGTAITISGIDHSGASVTGSYVIGDASTETVQDLLNQIQTAFGATATASIDTTGRITLTDNTTGASSMDLTLTVANPAGGSLNFGTIAQTTSATLSVGDGITMTFADGSNLTANDSFTVSGHPAGEIGSASAATSNTYTGTVAAAGTYTGTENKNYVLKFLTAGPVGSATYQISSDGGMTWGSAQTLSAATLTLGDGIQMTFSGGGNFGVNDTFTVNGYAAGYYRGNDDDLNAVIGKNNNMTYNITGADAFTGQFASASVVEGAIGITADGSIKLTRGSTGQWEITTNTGYPSMAITSQTDSTIVLDADYTAGSPDNDIVIDLTGVWGQDDTINLSLTAGTTSGEIPTTFSGADSIDLLSALNALKSALSESDQDRAMDLIYAQIDNLESVGTQILQYETQAGAKLQSMEVTSGNHDDMDVQITNMLDDTENADLTKLITEFQMKQIAMEASYKMASQIGQMTIMDYL